MAKSVNFEVLRGLTNALMAAKRPCELEQMNVLRLLVIIQGVLLKSSLCVIKSDSGHGSGNIGHAGNKIGIIGEDDNWNTDLNVNNGSGYGSDTQVASFTGERQPTLNLMSTQEYLAKSPGAAFLTSTIRTYSM